MKQSPYTRRGIMPFLHRHAAAAIIVFIAIYLLVQISGSTDFYGELSTGERFEVILRFAYAAAAIVASGLCVWGLRRWLESRATARMRARRNAAEAPPNCPQCQYPLAGIAPDKTRVLGFWAERVVCPECGWAEP